MKSKASVLDRLTRCMVQTGMALGLVLSLAQSAQAALTHRYSFTTDASDSVGGANGTIMNNITFSNGVAVITNNLVSGATCNYIELPTGIINGYANLSVVMWVNVDTNGVWNEIYAFGNQTSGGAGANMLMFTPHSGATPNDFRMSYAQAAPGYNDEYVVIGTGTLDRRGPVCIGCVYDTTTSTMSLYLNGGLVSSTPSRALGSFFQLSNIQNVYSWLGRSMYNGDTAYNGTIDEFRIYDSVRSSFDIMIESAAGPDRFVPDAGALQSVAVVATNMSAAATQQARLVAAFANITNVNVTAYSSNWVSSAPEIISVDNAGLLTAGPNGGTTTISAVYNGLTGSAPVSVTAVVTNLVLSAPSTAVTGSARLISVKGLYSDGSTNDVSAVCTYSSGNTNILTVITTPTGQKLAAGTNGTTTLTASYQSKQASLSVTVVPLSMTHRWAFDDEAQDQLGNPNTNVVDSVGTANGILYPGSFLDGPPPFGTGSVNVDGTAGYVEFPRDLFTNYGSVTIETWVTDYGSRNWARVFDFGTSAGGPGQQGGGLRYMALTLPNNTGILRGWITIGSGDQATAMNGRPPASTQAHLVWTIEGATSMGKLYVDGVLVATNAAVTLTPEDVGPTFNNWLGRSQYNADAYFYGTYADFRVYNGALDPFSVAVDTAAGPNVVTNNPGTAQSIQLTVNSAMNEGDTQQATLTGQFSYLANPLPLTTVPGTLYSSSNTRVATVNAAGLVTATGPGTATITAAAFGKQSTAQVVVTAIPITLTHRWSFNDPVGSVSLHDSIGNADGQVTGLVTFDGTQGFFDTNAVSYVLLPQDLFINYNSISYEVWFTDAGSGQWARLVDIGNNNSHYMFLDAMGPNGQQRAAFNAGSGEGSSVINASFRPAVSNEHHVVLTQDALSHSAKLYIDGAMVAQNYNFTIRPKDIGTTMQGYIGRSQYADPYYFGKINEIRTWQGAISPQQVYINYAAGPETVLSSPGAPQSVTVVSTNMTAGYLQQARVLATFGGVNNVNVTSLATNWSSSDPAVAKVDSRGVITAVGPGSATISATYGTTASTAITVAAPTAPVLAHRYSFAGSAADSVGGANGTALGTASFVNGRVVLDGAAATYVQLPGSAFGGMSEMSVETWFTYPLTNVANSRVWDFGDGNFNNYMGFVAKDDTRLRYNFGGGQADQTMPGATGASFGTNLVHAVWVISPALGSAKLYINGLWKETFVWTAPLTAISNAVGYLGHAVTTNVPPGNMIGAIDEFRIWNGALDQLQVASSYAAGPDNPLIAPGAPASVSMVLNDPIMILGTKQRPRVSATFAAAANVNLTAYPGLVFTSGSPAIVAVTGDDQLQAVGAGTANITVTFGGKSTTLPLTVAAQQVTMMHRYSFNADARDSIGKADGTLYGLASIVNGGVVLNGTRNPQTYVELPRDIISGYDKMTVEAWASIAAAPGTWIRMWDFGNHVNAAGQNYIYFSPFSGANNNRPSRLGLQATTAVGTEADADLGPLTNRYVHVTCVVDSAAGSMTVYTNAVLASSYTGPLPIALSTLNNVYSYLGRSQFNDNWYLGAIDEFRIYYGAMSAAQVSASYAGGANPDQLGATVGTGNNIIVYWGDSPITAGLKLQYTTDLGSSNWPQAPGTPTLSNGVWSQTVPMSGGGAFFRLGR